MTTTRKPIAGSCGLWSANRRDFVSPRGLKPAARRAFSLVEMMIAIIILGLGLVMVATIFPVAWDRARTLSEFTVEQSAAGGAQTTLAAILRPAGHALVEILPRPTLPGTPYEELRITSGSLAGDMFFDPTLTGPPTPFAQRYLAILAFADTSVHSLNVENMLAVPDRALNDNPLGLVAENPWDLEDPTDIVQTRLVYPDSRDYPTPDYPRNRAKAFPDKLFYGGDNCLSAQGGAPQIRVWQRLYPPMDAPPAAGEPDFDQKLAQWNEKLTTRRFCWAVLHRLRSRVGPEPLPTGVTPQPWKSDDMVREAAAAMGTTRTFDMYYVTLRRPRSTNRYARQDAAPARIPNPFSFVRPVQPVEPAALPPDKDLMFPVAWRVPMELPATLSLAANRTGVPTEILVPPATISGEKARMLVQMFPAGTQFIDEITGSIYRVAKRRIVDDEGEKSVLTLDREIVVEDLDLPLGDSRCEVACMPGTLEPEELLRTVWVFPPPVDRSQSSDEDTPQFDGPSPVVDIEVGALSISPSS